MARITITDRVAEAAAQSDDPLQQLRIRVAQQTRAYGGCGGGQTGFLQRALGVDNSQVSSLLGTSTNAPRRVTFTITMDVRDCPPVETLRRNLQTAFTNSDAYYQNNASGLLITGSARTHSGTNITVNAVLEEIPKKVRKAPAKKAPAKKAPAKKAPAKKAPAKKAAARKAPAKKAPAKRAARR